MDEELKDNSGVKQVIADFKTAKKFFNPIHKEMEKDFEFTLGKQWNDEDVQELEEHGRPALTINKIRPMIKLMTGIERQNRSDLVAFPEGEEDGIKSDIVTRLEKNVTKRSNLTIKTSGQFKTGVTCGLAWLEGYLIESDEEELPRLGFKDVSPFNVFYDPEAKEYDLSDAKFLIKFSPNLSKDQILELFPDKKDKIESLGKRTVDLDTYTDRGDLIDEKDYPPLSQANDKEDQYDGYDLIEYYYKENVEVQYLVDNKLGQKKRVEDKTLAEAYIAAFPTETRIEKKMEKQVKVKQIVGNEILFEGVAWSYPKWKGYPLFPFMAEHTTIEVKNKELRIQGIPRQLRDLQREFNKRRSQELAHLNSTVNSGWWYSAGSLAKSVINALKKFGSSPGFVGEVDLSKSGGQFPQRIVPQPLSQGHAQLAQENAQDLKEISGVNPDLLANDSESQSGRAILLKQRQGLVMVQESLDNYSETKKIIGRFILSQLSEIYNVETAVRVIGEQYFKNEQAFHSPVMGEDQKPVINPQTGELETEVDMNIVGQVITQILNDTSLGVYDVTVGEGAYNETTKLANQATLDSMLEKGFPVPPEVYVQESNLPESSKTKILQAITRQQLAVTQAQKSQENVNV